jgi:hypothetical protein
MQWSQLSAGGRSLMNRRQPPQVLFVKNFTSLEEPAVLQGIDSQKREVTSGRTIPDASL